MGQFPLLKTGAPVQYPLDRSIRFQTESVQFLDGSRQKYRLYGAGLRRWSIQLDGLDDSELAALTAFLEAQGGDPFAFVDPATGGSVARCAIAEDRFEAGTRGELMNNVRVVIEELP